MAAIYFIGLFFTCVGANNAILSFIGVVSYVPVLYSVLFSYLSVILMIILAFIKFKEE
jgi:hypothetical protein